MKALKEIPPKAFDNSDDPVFKNAFFDRFKLKPADQPLELSEAVKRDYRFPTFYADVTCSLGVFMCSYEKAAKLVGEQLHPKISPVKMTQGRSLVAFSCYEYKNVMGVLPYNEIAVAIPVMVNTGFQPPVLPMLMSNFKHFGYYIAAMPVTSYENQLRGNKIWGLPKVTQEVAIYSENDLCVTQAFEENGENYLTLKLPKTGKPTNFDVSSHLYSKLNDQILQSPTNFKSTFNVNKNTGLLFNKNKKSDVDYLKLGTSPSAQLLLNLEIEEIPFQTRYTEGMSSCFDLPNTNPPVWLSDLNV
jgi:hypothetical protein